jgi:hypothetical protein
VSDRPTIELPITLDGHPAESETTYTWAGPYILSLHTVLPQPDLALELHSTFIGHRGVPTTAVHLVLGPPGHEPVTSTAEHPHEQLNPAFAPRACAYEHAHQLIEILDSLAIHAAVNVPGEQAFAQLERVEQP